MDNAGGHVLSRVLAATEETGLLEVRQEDAGRGKVAGLLRGKSTTVITPDAGAIGAARAEIARVADGWTAFGQTNGELATELVKRCQKAIDAQEFSDDSGGGSDSGGGGFD